MKDINYQEINRDFDNQLMSLNKDQVSEIDQILEIDSMFLREHSLMDYSFLLAIQMKEHKVTFGVTNKTNSLTSLNQEYDDQQDDQ